MINFFLGCGFCVLGFLSLYALRFSAIETIRTWPRWLQVLAFQRSESFPDDELRLRLFLVGLFFILEIFAVRFFTY